MTNSFDRLFGDVIANTSVDGVILTETVYAPRLKLPVHAHKQAYFCLVLSGSFTETYGEHTRSCGPSTLIFHPAGESHSDLFHTGARCFNIQIDASWLDRVQPQARIMTAPADLRGGRSAYLAKRLYGELCKPDRFSSLAVQGLTLEIVADVSRHVAKASASRSRWLEKAKEIIDEEFSERLSLNHLAAALEVHPVHLAREFHRFYRCTIGDYIRERRIASACHQISSTDSPLCEIALAAGFFDQSHFTRTFKIHTGTTPSRYRAALRQR